MKAAVRIIKEGGADMIKVDAAANHPDVCEGDGAGGHPRLRAIRPHPADRAQVRHPVFVAELVAALATKEAAAKLVEEAQMLEECGAVALDFTNSGPVAGEAVVKR